MCDTSHIQYSYDNVYEPWIVSNPTTNEFWIQTNDSLNAGIGKTISVTGTINSGAGVKTCAAVATINVFAANNTVPIPLPTPVPSAPIPQ